MNVLFADQKVGHSPLDGAPVVGDQHVRPQLEQRTATAAEVSNRVALAERHGGKGHVEVRVQPLAAGGVAVHGDDGVPPDQAEPVGEGGETHLRPTYREGGKNMQQQGQGAYTRTARAKKRSVSASGRQPRSRLASVQSNVASMPRERKSRRLGIGT